MYLSYRNVFMYCCINVSIISCINLESLYGIIKEELKMLYEFINVSDKITFCAINDDIARTVTLLLGEGKAGCKKESGELLDYCFTAFGGPAPDEVYEKIENFVNEGNEDLVNALKTVACCDFNERDIYNEYTENSSNRERCDKWNEKHRTSLNNFSKYAYKLALFISERNKDSTDNEEVING